MTRAKQMAYDHSAAHQRRVPQCRPFESRAALPSAAPGGADVAGVSPVRRRCGRGGCAYTPPSKSGNKATSVTVDAAASAHRSPFGTSGSLHAPATSANGLAAHTSTGPNGRALPRARPFMRSHPQAALVSPRHICAGTGTARDEALSGGVRCAMVACALCFLCAGRTLRGGARA
jgi:hypothetical protein